MRAVVTAERAELEAAAASLRAHGRVDAAGELETKAAVLAVLAELAEPADAITWRPG